MAKPTPITFTISLDDETKEIAKRLADAFEWFQNNKAKSEPKEEEPKEKNPVKEPKPGIKTFKEVSSNPNDPPGIYHYVHEERLDGYYELLDAAECVVKRHNAGYLAVEPGDSASIKDLEKTVQKVKNGSN